jgi:hypothetical protein
MIFLSITTVKGYVIWTPDDSGQNLILFKKKLPLENLPKAAFTI